MSDPLKGFLADTWWYAMTTRLPDEEFLKLTSRRVEQGFTATQVVVGIPPETTPENQNAASPFGAAWNWSGEFNDDYLKFARERIGQINRSGLRAIVYGAWGQQISWLGTERMIQWWQKIIEFTSDLDVLYCLTGESNLHLGWGDLGSFRLKWSWPLRKDEILRNSPFFRRLLYRLYQRSKARRHRCRAWSQVLENVVRMTGIPVMIHPIYGETGYSCVENPHLLAANTAQTGHSHGSSKFLYQLPLAHAAMKDPAGRPFINLEPWYEGILDRFYGADQLYAYWVSMLAGAASYCYGAHGIWNAGDGIFLNHWGRQIFHEALTLDTPRLIGLSHKLFQPFAGRTGESYTREENGKLISIERKSNGTSFIFFPETANARNIPAGKIWLPMEGVFTDQFPVKGQALIIQKSEQSTG